MLQGRLCIPSATEIEADYIGNRTTSSSYGADGLVASVTDPLLRTTSYARDFNGRITTDTRPDLEVTAMAYAAEGQTTSVTPPGQPAHAMAYNAVELLQRCLRHVSQGEVTCSSGSTGALCCRERADAYLQACQNLFGKDRCANPHPYQRCP
jgi:YD repeat-containing protein